MAAPALPVADRAPDPLPGALAADLAGTFERLVLAYQGRIFAFALRFCGDRRDAEEIAQDTFVRAYAALGGYDAARIRALALRPWLYQIALNLARNRARGRRPVVLPLDGGEGEAMPPAHQLAGAAAEHPEAQAERREQGAALAALVLALPAQQRGAVILRHIAGLPYPEIATILGQPLGTVKANVHRGTRTMRAGWLARLQEEVHHD